jgi:hypothetical protein
MFGGWLVNEMITIRSLQLLPAPSRSRTDASRGANELADTPRPYQHNAPICRAVSEAASIVNRSITPPRHTHLGLSIPKAV